MSALEAQQRRDPWDYTDREGAETLKATIEEYWRKRGYDIQVALIPGAFTPALRASRFDVRSNLVNGMPRGSSVRPAAENSDGG